VPTLRELYLGRGHATQPKVLVDYPRRPGRALRRLSVDRRRVSKGLTGTPISERAYALLYHKESRKERSQWAQGVSVSSKGETAPMSVGNFHAAFCADVEILCRRNAVRIDGLAAARRCRSQNPTIIFHSS